MEFQTKVDLPRRVPPVAHGEEILLMGSCFAENIGRRLQEAKFEVDVNPYGVLYNPLSLSAALHELTDGKRYAESDLFCRDGYWHSPMHHSRFSDGDVREVLRRINDRIAATHSRMGRHRWWMLTWGTAFVYRQADTGRIVGNCHKQPEGTFRRQMLGVEETVEEYTSLLADAFARNSELKLLLTVSPIRHVRDGLHANQLSKATLLLAADALQRRFPDRVVYFPAYEILMDELRDYRFYADDMFHPSSVAVDYLWERFSECFFSAETQTVVETVEQLRRDIDHRPLAPESEAYRRFLGKIVLKIETLTKKYPYLDFENEMKLCRTRLNP